MDLRSLNLFLESFGEVRYSVPKSGFSGLMSVHLSFVPNLQVLIFSIGRMAKCIFNAVM